MDDIFSDAERVLHQLCGPMGGFALGCRHLIVDFKDIDGQDFNRELMTLHDGRATDEMLVESIRGELAGAGYTLTALGEFLENGGRRALYLAPGYMEEALAELGQPVPTDILAALEAAGAGRPVNWRELAHKG